MKRLNSIENIIFRPRSLLAIIFASALFALLPANPHAWFGSRFSSASDSVAGTNPRVPHAPLKPGETRAMTIKELGNFSYDDKAGGIPADVKALDGMNIRLRGFMIPTEEAKGITHFILVPAVWGCCFGKPPEVQHIIFVDCPKGKHVVLDTSEVWVEGKLKVKETRDEGFVVSVFGLAFDQLKPVSR